jgi:lysyl-tRNA synthetase, class I
MNPVWHIHNGKAPDVGVSLSFSMLMNLVSASNAEDKATLWGFIARFTPGSTPENAPKLDALVGYAVRYYHDFVKPLKQFKTPDADDIIALNAVKAKLQELGVSDADTYQNALYELGRSMPRFQDFAAKNATPDKPGVTAAWFSTLYQLLLGSEKGPRFGSFIALYGVKETIGLIDASIKR